MKSPGIRFYQVPDNPLVRLGLVLAGIAILALSFVVGVFFLAIAAGLAIIGSVVLAVRGWFLRRRRSQKNQDDILDVEYRVISRQRERDRKS